MDYRKPLIGVTQFLFAAAMIQNPEMNEVASDQPPISSSLDVALEKLGMTLVPSDSVANIGSEPSRCT